MTVGLQTGVGQEFQSPPSRTVNVFDLTSKPKGDPGGSLHIYSAKERAARITLFVVLTMVILTSVSLLIGEALGLQWTFCNKAHNTTAQDTPRYQWPWNWKHTGPSLSVSESYKDHWNTLSIPEKRKELIRVTLGELDLYDVYDISKDTRFPLDSEEKT